jgi:transposase
MSMKPKLAERILELSRGGMTAKEIRKEIGCSRAYAEHVIRHGLDGIREQHRARKARYLAKRGKTQRIGVDRSAEAYERARPVVEAVINGCSFRNAGERFGLNKNQVSGLVSRYGAAVRQERAERERRQR